MKYYLFAISLSLPACSRGSHVEPVRVEVTKYSCQFSPSLFQADRRIALCETEEACTKICAENHAKEGM